VEALIQRHPLRVAMEERDLEGVAEALAPDVVLHSPITSSFRFAGREEVTALLGIVRELLEDVDYFEEGVGDPGTVVRLSEGTPQRARAPAGDPPAWAPARGAATPAT
jgi:hypothetical protein